MSFDKTTPIDFMSGKQRLTRYSIVIINAATLIGTILFVTWVLGKIVTALHALVFSLALAETPDQFPTAFPTPEDAITNAASPFVLPDPEIIQDNPILTIVQRSDWRL